MKDYDIKYTETYQGWYRVRANSPEEGKEKLLDDTMNGRVDGPSECINSGCEEVKEATE